MRLGALLGPILDAGKTDTLAEQARAFAGEGYRSLWSAQAIGRGFMITDPFIALTVAASVTDDIELGTAIVQVPLYHPMDLAHRCFSLQQLSGSRLILGVGAGSTEQDFTTFGRDYAGRFRAFNNTLGNLREIFASGGTTEASLSPWPAVQGGPSLFYGTWGKGVARAAVDFDGWIASGAYRSVEELESSIAGYREAGGGRAIVSTIQVGGDTDPGELRERLRRYAEAGFDDAVVMLLPGGPSPADVRRLLD